MTRLIIAVIVTLLIDSVCWGYGSDDEAKKSLQQKLSSEFILTTITTDRSNIVTAGTEVALLKFGLLMYSTASPVPPLNTYKNGRISQGWTGFGRDITGTLLAPGNATTNSYPHRQFQTVERLWITGMAVDKKRLVLTLYSDPYEDIHYYGQLQFPFDKQSSTASEMLDKIGEVLQKVDLSQFKRVAGTYVDVESSNNNVQLNEDGTFSAVASGQNYAGLFIVQGGALMLQWGNGVQRRTLQGDTITIGSSNKWVKQSTAQNPPGSPSLSVASLKLPAIYVNAQTSSDQLQLNADRSFSLQENGQTYHGTFHADGSTLEIDIEPDTKTTATIDGNKLTDGSGQTWVRKDTVASSRPSSDVLRNQDVIELTKAGNDDATIVAKVASSQCQFDTSTAALIDLKKGGVSGAVIKAMVDAGKSLSR